QIEQVLLNLLSNAVDAMPRGGTVRIALAPAPGADGGDAVSFAVSDEGMGIPEEIRDSIFDPFFSTKEIGKGTGLGLSISYGIVRDHGGDILLESQPGRGTTFRVILPRDGKPEPRLAPQTDHSS
ncbi:MAG: histidine kinase, partial [Myxococcales bacterium]|nr:histidine kinase [Myxococcales bacterium]